MTTYELAVPLIALAVAAAGAMALHWQTRRLERREVEDLNMQTALRRFERSMIRALWVQGAVIVAASVGLLRLLP